MDGGVGFKSVLAQRAFAGGVLARGVSAGGEFHLSASANDLKVHFLDSSDIQARSSF